ncbi:NAD(P)H-binding protein [Congregibacter litoralis]|uniref:Nucleoside-diphosphate-sugar epimerase n=1 Tax=Congregibacter litoralis KT71 TaxID=314285 RepID=A4A9A2_9GAMM|nr:NAD(P)H-binding protein [Congregibacter litoralis]EAQ97644.1 Nucleoside-diphosphate-sugar epimerase [Congregibacter litoralis KT71]
MEKKTIAIIGFGDLGERLSGLLPADTWHCLGLRRTANAVPEGVESIAIDLEDAPSLGVLAQRRPDALVIALSPSDRSAKGYEAGFGDAMAGIVAGLGAHVPERAFFVSSTRVYSEADGGWVDEDSATAEDDPHVAAILAAERAFLDGVENSVVLRAGGLYGHGPGPLLKRVTSGRLTPASPPRYGNRIHRDDVAGFMAAVLQGQATVDATVINLVDDAPVPLQDVEAWLCRELGVPYAPPGPANYGEAPGHKRIRNGRLHRSGYSLQFPDYRRGYAAVLHRWMAHSEREDGLDLH